jgi:hypothetical protein
MKVFISWSGERSKLLAKSLSKWLPVVLHFVEPWVSESDIAAGERWSLKIAENLEEARFGILCLTKDNFTAPWVMFEAGAIGKFVSESAVCPYLLDLDHRDISGPLTQYQAKKAEKADTLELLESINAYSDQPMTSDRLAQLFEALWPKLAEGINTIPPIVEAKKHIRPQSEILEDLVESVRAIERRLSDIEIQFSRERTKREPTNQPLEERRIECPGCFELVDCCNSNCPICGKLLDCS